MTVAVRNLAALRSREAWRILQSGGVSGLAKRAVRVAYRRLGAYELESPIDTAHIADSQNLDLTTPTQRPTRGTPLTVGWITQPPSAGSGGHTTLFRMVEAVEAAGHTCVIYLHDLYDGDVRMREHVIRQFWPKVKAEIRSVNEGPAPLDAYVASGWDTAHVLATWSAVPTRRLYFVQDFEPYFYPVGSHYVLAEDTYRFGFRTITVGPMLAEMLKNRYGVEATVAEFGCDLDVYRLTNREPRRGVIFYAKQDTARRGFVLGTLALREFHRRHPECPIHLFGDVDVQVPFPATNHGVLKPPQLAELYNQCAAGVALSFTNLSLVPDEMLACGAVPVAAESPFSAGSIKNPHLRWTRPTPGAIAAALSEIVANGPLPEEVASSGRATAWKSAQQVTLDAIEDEVYGPIGAG